MRTAVFLLFLTLVILLLDNSDAWGRRRRRSRSSGGRHRVGLSRNSVNYNYRGSRWNGRGSYNRRNGHIRVGANRGNHNFNGHYNHKNKGWGVNYTWRGRKRRDLGTSEDVANKAEVRLRSLGEDVAIIKTQLSALVPNVVHVTLPTHEGPITKQVLAQDILCLVHQFGKILPQLEAFTKKMFAKHSAAYGVKPDAKQEKMAGCQAIEPPAAGVGTLHVLSGGDLAEMKTFVGALILTRLELKAALPQTKTGKS